MSGCADSYLPATRGAGSVPSADVSHYPLRTDWLVVGKTGLDGAPKRWPTPGFSPLKSAQFPQLTPDRDLAEDVRAQLGRNVLDPANLTSGQVSRLARLLDEYFGTPLQPCVRLPDWPALMVLSQARADVQKGVLANLALVGQRLQSWEAGSRQALRRQWDQALQTWKLLRLDDATLARGSVLYRRWCLACHGPTGAGDGRQAVAQAAWPRDYRQGIFKFTTAFPPPDLPRVGRGPAGKPLRADLIRTLRRGIDGSMMPAFPHLSDEEIEALVSYVIHLSIRGETEFATMARAMQPTEEDPDFEGPELDALFVKNLVDVLYNWGAAAQHPIPIPPHYLRNEDDRLLSALRGYKLYNSAEFGCASCHVKYGSEQQLKWDLWGGVVQPRNLLLGVYRGGRRGQDLYARLYGGIHPSGMPSFRNTLATGPSYPDRPDKIWNVVHFLQALADPYDRQRLQDPQLLERFKKRLRQQGDLFLDDVTRVTIDF
ncbi:MAG: cytochrome c [Gemmataceae bacterium]|nr:cytochrome c [Gemmataceae bacterium]MDW8243743.1 cytochrome c [Thermogemmata sp.]